MIEVKIPLDEKVLDQIRELAHQEKRSIRMQLAKMVTDQLKQVKK